ncbi:NADH dehydrogenase [ubiquinone] 1 beta subcomplex subunit 4 [Parasteatoda tepidariorum]|uniref:NADH dehydrogenase [ubiquinone] 1 beta subcomplex subunit 4 n=1 Tax=Parasteatoda tepidariorum TaxID=114398 RepID=UPI00077F93CB|nr:uncharacterized protein LOC107440675 [Parasteatoda tepidariorum]XP_015909141.1 uncharacterized protein LOC107440675 [Parasteatoda tepidariorum]
MAASLSILKGVRRLNVLQSASVIRNFSVTSKLCIRPDAGNKPDASPEEVRLVEERKKLRRALRQEYLRKLTDPYGTDPIVFDPAVQRYYSMHMTMTERFIPTFKNWLKYMFSIIVPIVAYGLFLKNSKAKFERKCRTGELEYKDRIWRHQ